MPGTRPHRSEVKSESARPFTVGDQVLVKFGPASLVPAEIIEDRGLIGHARQQIYRVRTIDTGPVEPVSFEVRAEDVLPNPRRKRTARAS